MAPEECKEIPCPICRRGCAVEEYKNSGNAPTFKSRIKSLLYLRSHCSNCSISFKTPKVSLALHRALSISDKYYVYDPDRSTLRKIQEIQQPDFKITPVFRSKSQPEKIRAAAEEELPQLVITPDVLLQFLEFIKAQSTSNTALAGQGQMPQSGSRVETNTSVQGITLAAKTSLIKWIAKSLPK